MGVNYGWNKVRFPAPVPAGSRIRASIETLSVDEVGGRLVPDRPEVDGRGGGRREAGVRGRVGGPPVGVGPRPARPGAQGRQSDPWQAYPRREGGRDRNTEHRGTPKGAAPGPAGRPGRLPVPRRAGARCSTWARPGRFARAWAATSRARGAGMVGHVRDIEFIVTETEAEALLAEQEFIKRHRPRLQRPPARRQVVPLHRDQPRRGVPAHLLHARAPPPRPRLLRPLLQRQARARDARPARQGLPVPHLRRPRAGPGQRRRPASTTTSSAARRPASATSPRGSTARTSTRSSTSSRGATARSSGRSTRA